MVSCDQKAIELRSQFGANAGYVALEILDVLKSPRAIDASIVYWRRVLKNVSPECPKSPIGKHEYVSPPDSFDPPYCKHCFDSN